jgi:hypothetical protein
MHVGRRVRPIHPSFGCNRCRCAYKLRPAAQMARMLMMAALLLRGLLDG